MSEKELRKVLAQCGLRLQEEVNADGASILDENWTDKVTLLEDICEAASEPPDVVAVALWLMRAHDKSVSGHDRRLILRLAESIQEKFGFVLTDDGWEWTEEATDE